MVLQVESYALILCTVGDGEEVRSLDEFQSAVLSSYNNGLKDETRDTHRDFTFAMETQVVKIEKSHKEASKGTPRWVLMEDDQDDRNELTLFLAGHLTLKGNKFPQLV
ncbi:hypothetical protein YC2023_006201 [Brassica napus]